MSKLEIIGKKITYKQLRRKLLSYLRDNNKRVVDNLVVSYCTITNIPGDKSIYEMIKPDKKNKSYKYKFCGVNISRHTILNCTFIGMKI